MPDTSRPFIELHELTIARTLEDSENMFFFTRLFNLGAKTRIGYHLLHMALYTSIYWNGNSTECRIKEYEKLMHSEYGLKVEMPGLWAVHGRESV